jgi:diguanylate cyclase (GGDEF)-like protein
MSEISLWIWRGATRRHPLLTALLVTVLVVPLDYVSGTDLRLFPLYFIPLSLVAGSHSTRQALATAVALAGVWAASNYNPANPTVYVGNIASQLAAFVVVALLVNSHKSRADVQQQLASTDPLTGLLNSRAFFAAANRELAVQRRKLYPLTMAYLDVDDFKQINTTLGHMGADGVLRDTAQAMRRSLRQTDLIGRVGGDEFAILLPDTAAEPAFATLERLRLAVLHINEGRNTKITVSLGAVVFEQAAESVNTMLEVSDRLMYEVKGKSKDRVEVRRSSDLPPLSPVDFLLSNQHEKPK